MSQTCEFCVGSMDPRARRRHGSLIKVQHAIERYALDNKGALGSLYDSWTDSVRSTLSIPKNFIFTEDVEKNAECEIVGEGTVNDENYLQIIPIGIDLYISIVLGMTSITGGTLMVYDYKSLDDRSVRFVYYHRTDRQICFLNDIQIVRHILTDSLLKTEATHIITGVEQGIDFVIAVESSNNEDPSEIQCVLAKVCDYFTKSDVSCLTPAEEDTINRCTLTIFTQIDEIRSLKNAKNSNEILQSIRQYIFEGKRHFPLLYTLHPIRCLYPSDGTNGGIFRALEPCIINRIQEIINDLFNKIKTAKDLFDEVLSDQFSQCLHTRSHCALEEFNQIKETYSDIQYRLAEEVLKHRREKYNISTFHESIKDLQYEILNTRLDTLHKTLRELKNKDSLIAQLKEGDSLEYYNVADVEDKDDDQGILEGKVLSTHHQQPTRILCSSSDLMAKDLTQHKKLCEQLMNEQKTNPSLHLVFADFSYCKLTLPQMKLLPTNLEPSIVKSQEVNILLLGETGVGKSTLINALINYFSFESIEQAGKDGPTVLIPVSFTMINNDQFDECEIKSGEHKNSNEDFDHLGQTITQHCQSYVFNLSNNTKLRMIDTPGIADTRGISQDDQNIQNILSYVSHFSHLNAVCILLKPNTTRLNVLFRSCLEQIFNFLGPNARENIVFCFTSSRSTFFLPGNTAPLLKKMLNDLPPDHAPQLGKNNTFCFDSEAFRYLVALQPPVSIRFDEEQKNDFHTSWSKSVEESNRWIKSIKSRSPYPMNSWHSIKHAQILITNLIQPILETLRYFLRNQLLKDTEHQQYAVVFHAESLSCPSYLCTTCPFKIEQRDLFPMIDRPVHQYRTTDERAQYPCQHTKHLPILYKLKYDIQSMVEHLPDAETNDIRDRLLRDSVALANFLLHRIHLDEDPFLLWFDLFIEEEQILFSQDSSKNINRQLHTKLVELKDQYVRQLHKIHSNPEEINIEEIYQWIKRLQEFDLIKEQMKMIKESEITIMQFYQNDISLIDKNTPLLRTLTEH